MVTAYPVKGKQKSVEICRAFIEGCGGVLAHDAPDTLFPGAAFFYGVDASNVHLWDQVLKEEREFYYCDNSYFDQTRQTYFRVTQNRVQHSGLGVSTGARFANLKIAVNAWRNVHTDTGYAVVCPQSDWFMSRIVRYSSTPGQWLTDATVALASAGIRVRVRDWSPDKTKLSRSLPEDLIGARMLVTHSSAAAITALLSGVPIICAKECAAARFSGSLNKYGEGVLTHPPRDQLLTWAGVLADNQWTLDEMRDGVCWKGLHS